MHGLLGIYRTQASISYKQKSAVYVAYSQSGTSHLISQWFLYQTIDNENETVLDLFLDFILLFLKVKTIFVLFSKAQFW